MSRRADAATQLLAPVLLVVATATLGSFTSRAIEIYFLTAIISVAQTALNRRVPGFRAMDMSIPSDVRMVGGQRRRHRCAEPTVAQRSAALHCGDETVVRPDR